jgi:hypothetical protein
MATTAALVQANGRASRQFLGAAVKKAADVAAFDETR